MKRWTQRAALAALVAVNLAALSGCIALVAGGAMVAGGAVATDRRTSGTVVEDQGIEFKASARIRDGLGERVHVNVTSYNRQVLLTGEVPNADDKALVERIAANVENVRNIVNELAIAGNTSLSSRSSDTLITSKVKASLVDAKDLISSAFKVVTERGTVYLMGRVSQREAKRATDITASVSGVQKVVKIFEYISEDELAGMLPQPSKTNTTSNPKSDVGN
ncbi:BON domain-containing protein [Curvibacter sp. CHRR-16]|uniref:BON domain-containing protein n=1 Tax=Curvibacter sp. CHRR-16 TaxID=2835872 RepID=UPI001BD9BAE5|nr:BON domain-containing protein [Curvibacter sp. CHRR-16]MBT0570581.1 BON domain-containing protein [Curvibacter sp. CHRR-16]